MRKTLLAIFIVVVAGSGLCQSRPESKTLVIRNVTVIDCTGAEAKPDMTVVVRDGRIAQVGKTTDITVPQSAEVIDASGKFLIPGLWDMHGHLTDAGEGSLAQLIENGVTGVRDMGGDLELVQRYRREIEQGKRVGPRILAAGPLLDGPTEAKWHVVAKDEAEARALVRSIKARGADFLKIHTMLSREAFFAAVDEAKKQGLPVAVHLPRAVNMGEASDAGVASLEHVEMVVQSALVQQDKATHALSDKQRLDAAFDALNGEPGTALWATLVKNGTYFVPTMVAYERGFVLWSNKPEAMMKRRPVHWRQIDVVAAMHKAGVKIMAGSDFSDWATVPGVDLHNELALLVEAGFSPLEALQSATLLPAEFLGRSRDLGTVEPGKVADLVLLDMNPLETISHTRKIYAVVLGGKYLPIQATREKMMQAAWRGH
ncbi:MAG TPA: amidohydrolase family protein [Terriglobales bacterium]|nr:amidohydrolase family protein [Terriglobales bacterium]